MYSFHIPLQYLTLENIWNADRYDHTWEFGIHITIKIYPSNVLNKSLVSSPILEYDTAINYKSTTEPDKPWDTQFERSPVHVLFGLRISRRACRPLVFSLPSFHTSLLSINLSLTLHFLSLPILPERSYLKIDRYHRGFGVSRENLGRLLAVVCVNSFCGRVASAEVRDHLPLVIEQTVRHGRRVKRLMSHVMYTRYRLFRPYGHYKQILLGEAESLQEERFDWSLLWGWKRHTTGFKPELQARNTGKPMTSYRKDLDDLELLRRHSHKKTPNN
ncbi:hypothetical protein J6590_021240 [Homalodisca vitripennis]|nr:hypothetical protein J6590_021240 [Homalodisca vitripennis]